MALVYYSHLKKPRKFLERIARRDYEQAKKTHQLMLTVTPEPFSVGDENIIMPFAGGKEDLYLRIIRACEMLPPDEVVFLVEDDILYPDEHFRKREGLRPGCWYYNLNVIFMSGRGFFEMHNRGAIALHQAFGRASAIIDGALRKIAEIKAGTFHCYEPAGSLGYDTAVINDSQPSVDIRNGMNSGDWTDQGGLAYYNDSPEWGEHKKLWGKYGA